MEVRPASDSALWRVIGGRPAAILFVLLCTMGTAPGCSRTSSDTVPDVLLGVWTTTDPRYSDRFLELRPHFVTFGLGEEGQAVYPVSSVDWTNESGQSSFTVYYEAEDGSENSMTLYHTPIDETLVLKNQLQTHWVRKRT